MYATTEKINGSNFTIRTMMVSDVTSYVSLFNYRKAAQSIIIAQTKKNIRERKPDEPNLYFAILKNNTVIGGIACIALEDSLCDAVIKIDLPHSEDLRPTIIDLFIKLARETYFYDDIYFEIGRTPSGRPLLSKPVPIAVNSRW